MMHQMHNIVDSIEKRGIFSSTCFLRWEFIKENKKVRKQKIRKQEKKKENKNSTRKVIKKKESCFFFWALSCFLSFFLFSFINSHLWTNNNCKPLPQILDFNTSSSRHQEKKRRIHSFCRHLTAFRLNTNTVIVTDLGCD